MINNNNTDVDSGLSKDELISWLRVVEQANFYLHKNYVRRNVSDL